jgi:hypothetical protein
MTVASLVTHSSRAATERRRFRAAAQQEASAMLIGLAIAISVPAVIVAVIAFVQKQLR